MRDNAPPAWAIHALADNEPQLEAEVGPSMLPIGLTEEIGCGGIGCVWHTLKPDVVFKLTTEEDEYGLAIAVMNMARPPRGVVRFYGAIELEQGADIAGMQFKAWGLWREWVESTARQSLAAAQLNRLDALTTAYNQAVSDFMHSAHGEQAWPTVEQIRKAARAMSRDLVKQDASVGYVHPSYTNPERYVAMDWIEAMMAATEVRSVALALTYFRKRRMLLHDVNEDNVGLVRRGGKPTYAIFDAHLIDYR